MKGAKEKMKGRNNEGRVQKENERAPEKKEKDKRGK